MSFSFSFWFPGYQHLLRHSSHWMQGGLRKPCIRKHFFVLRKCVGVPGVGSDEHVEAECCCRRRSHAVFVRHKLESDGFPTWFEGCIDAAHQRLARRDIEMVKNICQQNKVISAAKIRFERTTWARCVTAG